VRLHVGGQQEAEGWHILNIQPGPSVDIVGCVTSIPCETESVDEIYASHVCEHLSYQNELAIALAEMFRVLKPGGRLMVSVPDLDILCRLFISPHLSEQDRYHIMRIMMGGQTDPHDFHKAGFTETILAAFLSNAGFAEMRRVDRFDLFSDCSELVVFGAAISLNVEAVK